MPSRLTISLVIPAYNEESHLTACLQAALAQSLPFDEIIVVDNNSTDTTAKIAASFPGVRVVSEKRQGIVFARNRGFNAARGDIIARIDADTTLPVDWAAQIHAFYDQPSHAQTAWTSGGRFVDVPLPAFVGWAYGLLAFRSNQLLVGYPTLWGSSTALPRVLWQQVARETCSQNGMHEDLDLATHLHHHGFEIHYDPHVRVNARLRRVWADRHELWDYLQWWPQTLRHHRQRSWLICWLIGVAPLYIAASFLTAAERLLRLVWRSFTNEQESQVPKAFEV